MPARSAPVKLELKAVDTSRRTILAYAAVFGNIDRQGEVIAPEAFDRSLQTKRLTDIGVLVGHDPTRMPVGVPLSIEPDGYGLLTNTKVFQTAAGEELLQAAKELKAAGSSLGLSIGYSVLKDAWGTAGGKSARILQELDLGEYSFLPGQWAAANPAAHVVDVKSIVADPLRAELAAIRDRWSDRPSADIPLSPDSDTCLYEVVNAVEVVPDRLRWAAEKAATEARAALGLPYWLIPKWVVEAPGSDWKSSEVQRVHGPSKALGFHVREYVGSLFLKVGPTLTRREVAWIVCHEAAHSYQAHAGLQSSEDQCDRFAADLMDRWEQEGRAWLS